MYPLKGPVWTLALFLWLPQVPELFVGLVSSRAHALAAFAFSLRFRCESNSAILPNCQRAARVKVKRKEPFPMGRMALSFSGGGLESVGGLS